MMFSPGTQKEIDKLYKNRKHVELTIGTLKDGKMEVRHWGPDRQEKSGETLIYPVGSICKPFTASLLAKYISQGKLDLSAPINRYIPGLPERYYPSLEKLATHTSGYTTQPYTLWTTLPYFLKMNREGGLFHTNPYHGPCEKNANSGLAWRLEKDLPISWHGGATGAFSAFVGLNRETKTAAAVAANYGLVNAEPIGFSVLKNDL